MNTRTQQGAGRQHIGQLHWLPRGDRYGERRRTIDANVQCKHCTVMQWLVYSRHRCVVEVATFQITGLESKDAPPMLMYDVNIIQ